VQHRMAVGAYGSQVFGGVDNCAGRNARDRVYVMDLDKSFPNFSVNETEIEITNFATDSVNLDARSTIDMTAFISSDKDLLRATFGLALRFYLYRFQWRKQQKQR
jgi:hypothetical protein